MENVKLIFLSSELSGIETEVECYCNVNNQILIKISESDDHSDFKCVSLDRDTAIKLVKNLKKEISYLQTI